MRGKYGDLGKAWKVAKKIQEQSGFGLREEDCERSINGIVNHWQGSSPAELRVPWLKHRESDIVPYARANVLSKSLQSESGSSESDSNSMARAKMRGIAWHGEGGWRGRPGGQLELLPRGNFQFDEAD